MRTALTTQYKNMTTKEHLIELERDLEKDLLDARRELGLGRDEATLVLDPPGDRLRLGDAVAMEKIRALVKTEEEDLDLVQGRLGELNYILAEEDIDSLEMFDRYRDRILRALREAARDLERLEDRGGEWADRGTRVIAAWAKLSQRLDGVRHHLADEEAAARSEFDAERSHLVEELEHAAQRDGKAHPKHSFADRLRSEYQQVIPAIKALFVHPDEAVPKTAHERQQSRP